MNLIVIAIIVLSIAAGKLILNRAQERAEHEDMVYAVTARLARYADRRLRSL